MFVHDFTSIDRSFDDVVVAFGDRIRPRLAELVVDAYGPDRERWIEAGARGPDITPPGWAAVHVGAARFGDDAVVIPVAWNPTGGRLVAAVDADLRIAACGPHRTDIDLLGRYRLNPPVPVLSTDATFARRLTHAAVRRLLTAVSELVSAPPEGAETIAGGWTRATVPA